VCVCVKEKKSKREREGMGGVTVIGEIEKGKSKKGDTGEMGNSTEIQGLSLIIIIQLSVGVQSELGPGSLYTSPICSQ